MSVSEERLSSAASELKNELPASKAGQPPIHRQPIERPSEALVGKFRALAKQWRRETAHWSTTERKVENPTYREIVQLGWPIVPLLLEELRRKPSFWFLALQEITGINPAQHGSAGDVAAMARAWIEWGETEGFIE